MQTDRQTRTRGIVVALYRGKVVTRQSGSAMEHRTEQGGSPGAHARAKEAESWRKLAGS